MTRGAYYNENDAYAAAWLRNLVAAGHIAPGDVDERSIVDVRPDDLAGYDQCHFFAGIAGWSYALRLAGWPDDRPVWTGSCPCQPFSSAGKRRGTDDPRHLWPEWFRLIRECRPATIFGEQVASRDGLGWFDAVSSDLEGEGYAIGASDLCAAGVGAPHIRQRLYFVADADEGRCGKDRECRSGRGTGDKWAVVADNGSTVENAGPSCRLADAKTSERGRAGGTNDVRRWTAETGGPSATLVVADDRGARLAGRTGEPGHDGPERATVERGGDVGGMADTQGHRTARDLRSGEGETGQVESDHEGRGTALVGVHGVVGNCHLDRNPWTTCDWIPCRDGKARPTQPGLQPLAHGVPARVGRLRAYGNAINPWVGAAFVRVAMEIIG